MQRCRVCIEVCRGIGYAPRYKVCKDIGYASGYARVSKHFVRCKVKSAHCFSYWFTSRRRSRMGCRLGSVCICMRAHSCIPTPILTACPQPDVVHCAMPFICTARMYYWKVRGPWCRWEIFHKLHEVAYRTFAYHTIAYHTIASSSYQWPSL